jgi:predicted CoA-binding protein
VAGVSRDSRQAANAIYRKLRASGFEVVPVNQPPPG